MPEYKKYKRTCQNCGNQFTPNRVWQKYCSQKCQLTHYNVTHDIPGRLREERDDRVNEVGPYLDQNDMKID